MTNQKVSTMSKLNYLKKVALYLLAFVMIISFNETTVEAKGKTQLNTTSVTLTVGKKKTLKLKNYTKLSKKKIKKVKWSTSNKKVVSLKVSGKYKQNCKITAKKAGKATIKVKYNGKTYKCKVVVKKTSTKTTKPTEQPTTEVDVPTPNTNNGPTKPETPTNPNKPGTTENTTENTTEDTSVNTNTNSTDDNHDCWFSAVDTHYDAEKVGDYGYTVWTCSKCGKELATIQDTDPKERDYTLQWITVPATCTQDGYKAQYKVYDDGEKEMVPNTKTILTKLGHSWTYDYSEHHCPHVEVTCTSTCSRCGETHEDTGVTYNQIKSDQYNGYTVYIDLKPNNYDEQWQTTHGTYGASIMTKQCNHCKDNTILDSDYTLDEVYSQVLWCINDMKYKVVIRSNTFTNPTSGETSVINDIKDLCK